MVNKIQFKIPFIIVSIMIMTSIVSVPFLGACRIALDLSIYSFTVMFLLNDQIKDHGVHALLYEKFLCIIRLAYIIRCR